MIRRAPVALIVATITSSLWLGISGQERASRGYPLLINDLSAPGIDRGLRENDPPRPPRGTAAVGERLLRGTIIVKFRDGATPFARSALLSRVNGTAARALDHTDFDIVAIDDAADPELVARQLEAQPDVEYAQARYRVRPRFVPNDPLYSRQWNYPAIEMERAWNLNRGASNAVTVAVLDTGVAYRSGVFRYTAQAFQDSGFFFPALGTVDVRFAAAPDLGGADRFVAPRDFIWETTTPMDLDGHGTHVAGTIGQLTDNNVGTAGVAFNVRIMPVKVLDGVWDFIFDSPFFATDDVVARGIRYAADNGADILNLSIGRTGSPAPVIRSAITYAVQQGTFVVVAGGNEFENGNLMERFAEFAPAVDGLVSVAAVGRTRQRAYYSSTGSYIELAAPGGDQRTSTANGILQQTFDFDFVETYLDGPSRYRAPQFDVFAFQFFQGTSAAAPHVSGFAALLIQQGITSPAAIEAAMKRYATDLGPPGRDDEFGYGLINPAAALRGMGLVR